MSLNRAYFKNLSEKIKKVSYLFGEGLYPREQISIFHFKLVSLSLPLIEGPLVGQ